MNKYISSRISYWQVFRLVFVFFSFYLLFDALYRWNGFRFYSTFSEFLRGVALITILWSILSAVTTFLLWFPLRAIALISLHDRWNKIDRLLLFLYTFSSLAAITLIVRRNFMTVALSYHLKLAVLGGVILIAMLIVVAIERFPIRTAWKNIERSLLFLYAFILLGILIWIGDHLIWHDLSTAIQLPIIISIILIAIATLLYSDKARRWINIIQDRITLWVWVFSIWLLLSVPLVAYYAWFDKSYDKGFETVVQPSKAYENRPNILLVTFDALTSFDMSAYGYHRDTTPFISEWAKETSLFSGAKASGTSTAPTTTSLMTGKRVWNHRVFHNQGYKVDKGETENMPLLLKQNGYYNMAYMSSKFSIPERSNISNFFDIYHSPIMFKKKLNYFGRVQRILNILFGKNIILYDWIIKEDFIFGKFLNVVNETLLRGSRGFSFRRLHAFYDIEKQFNKLLEDIDNDPPEPFFAWTHLFPPHPPFLPPEPYKGIFGSSLQLKENNPSSEAIKHHKILTERAKYNEYIKYCDEKFKEFIEDVRLKNKMKNTVIILSSDHGFTSDYKLQRDSVFQRPMTNIPLIIKYPGREEGQIIDDLVEQIDIPATILDLAHIPLPDWIEGRSLVSLMYGKRLTPKPAFFLNFSSNSIWDQITKGSIAIWDSDYKVIHDLENDKSLLFNLKEDPDELNNLFDKETEVGQRLLKLIHDNLKKANESFSKGKR